LAFQAGAIVSQLTLDKSKFSTAIKGVKKETTAMGGWVKKNSAQFKRMGLAITAMGTAALFTFKKMVDKYVEVGDMVDKMSKRTAFAAETISELAYAADISGADISMLEKGVKKMSKTIVDAGYGLETYLRVFRELGLEIDDLMALSPEEQFMTIGAAIADMENDTLKTAAAVDVFGRSGTMLLPLFKEGAEGIAKLRKEAHELGIVFDEEAAAKAAKLKDAQTALKKAMQGLGFAIVEDTIPVLTQMATHFKDVFVNIQDNTQTFTGSILGFFKIIAMGIGGLMMAWTGLKAGVFKVASYVAGQLEKFLYAVVAQLAVLEKIPIVGKKLVPITDAIYETLKSVTAITQGYNEEGEKQIDVITNQATFLENLKKALDDAKQGFKDLATESAITSETIVKTALPAARDMTGALMNLSKGYEVSAYATEWAGETTAEMSEKQLEAFNAMAAGMQGGASGVVNAIKGIVIAEMLKALATSTMPFLAKLVMMMVTVGAVEAVFSSFMKSTKGYAKGGRIGTEGGLVGEEGPEYFAPAKPGTIIPLTGAGAGLRPVEVVIAPVINISNQIDQYAAQRIVRETLLPQLIDALENKIRLHDFQKALGV